LHASCESRQPRTATFLAAQIPPEKRAYDVDVVLFRNLPVVETLVRPCNAADFNDLFETQQDRGREAGQSTLADGHLPSRTLHRLRDIRRRRTLAVEESRGPCKIAPA